MRRLRSKILKEKNNNNILTKKLRRLKNITSATATRWEQARQRREKLQGSKLMIWQIWSSFQWPNRQVASYVSSGFKLHGIRVQIMPGASFDFITSAYLTVGAKQLHQLPVCLVIWLPVGLLLTDQNKIESYYPLTHESIKVTCWVLHCISRDCGLKLHPILSWLNYIWILYLFIVNILNRMFKSYHHDPLFRRY